MGNRGKEFNERPRENSSETAEEYTRFPDRANSAVTYEGLGERTADFFKKHSNFDEIIKSMTQAEKDAFNNEWVPGMFMDGKQYKGFENMSRYYQELTRIYDRILDRTELSRGIVLTRLATAELVLGGGHKFGTLKQLQAMEGKEVISTGNLSTAAAREGLTIGSPLSSKPTGSSWLIPKSVEYHISIPKGSKGIGMWIGDRRINREFGASQREFMLNRDIVFKVGKTTYDKNRDVFVVELKYTKRLPHNYTHY